MLMMAKAWEQGICSPYEFRKCKSSDINFIMDFMGYRLEQQEKAKHDAKVQQMMEQMQGKRW